TSFWKVVWCAKSLKAARRVRGGCRRCDRISRGGTHVARRSSEETGHDAEPALRSVLQEVDRRLKMAQIRPSPGASRHPLPKGEGMTSGLSLSHWERVARSAG